MFCCKVTCVYSASVYNYIIIYAYICFNKHVYIYNQVLNKYNQFATRLFTLIFLPSGARQTIYSFQPGSWFLKKGCPKSLIEKEVGNVKFLSYSLTRQTLQNLSKERITVGVFLRLWHHAVSIRTGLSSVQIYMYRYVCVFVCTYMNIHYICYYQQCNRFIYIVLSFINWTWKVYAISDFLM